MATLDDLKKLLQARGGFETVESKMTDVQIRMLGRVPPNASSHWVLVAATLLQVAQSSQWSVDYSKHYFLKKVGSGQKMFYAHRLIFQAPDMKTFIDHIMRAIHGAPQPARIELQEFPLSGSGAHREATSGRGAFSALSAPVGPLAAHAALAGRGAR